MTAWSIFPTSDFLSDLSNKLSSKSYWTCAGFRFVEYGQPEIEAPTKGEPIVGAMVKSIIRCDVPENGVPMTCGVGSSNAKASSTSVANEKAFTFGQEITVGVCSFCCLCSISQGFCCQSKAVLKVANKQRLLTARAMQLITHGHESSI